MVHLKSRKDGPQNDAKLETGKTHRIYVKPVQVGIRDVLSDLFGNPLNFRYTLSQPHSPWPTKCAAGYCNTHRRLQKNKGSSSTKLPIPQKLFHKYLILSTIFYNILYSICPHFLLFLVIYLSLSATIPRISKVHVAVQMQQTFRDGAIRQQLPRVHIGAPLARVHRATGAQDLGEGVRDERLPGMAHGIGLGPWAHWAHWGEGT